jgi:hypothetical protein
MAPCCASSKLEKADHRGRFAAMKALNQRGLRPWWANVHLCKRSGGLPYRHTREWPRQQSSSSDDLPILAHPGRIKMPLRSKCDAEAIPPCASRVSDNANHHARDSGATNTDGRPTSLCPDKKRQSQVAPEQPRPDPEQPRPDLEQPRLVRDWDDTRHKAHDGIRCHILGRLPRPRPYPARRQRQRCRQLSFSCQPLLSSL